MGTGSHLITREGVVMKMQVVYVSRLMKAGEVREACAMVKLMPDRLLASRMLEQKEKAALCGNTETA